MRQPIILFVPILYLLASSAAAGPCTAIIDATVAEMRAGADGWWSDEVEGLVRAAAGSACVKAQSGRYAQSGAPARKDDPVAAAGSAAPADTHTGADDAVAAPAQAGAESDSQPEADSDDGSWSFGGMTFRSLSGSPGTKPYQRKRKADEEG